MNKLASINCPLYPPNVRLCILQGLGACSLKNIFSELQLRNSLPFIGATLYTHLLEKEMIINSENKNGLKGQYNLAQGKRSVALGWRTGIKIVRAITFIKARILFRTGEMTLCFPEMMSCNSVRKGLLALFIESPWTDFLLHPLPRAAFRFVPPSTLPWAGAMLPFQGGKNS